MINKPLPFKGLNIRIPIMIPVKERWFTDHLGLRSFRVIGYYVGVITG